MGYGAPGGSSFGAYRWCSDSGLPSGSRQIACQQTPESNVSLTKRTPSASRRSRAAATSLTFVVATVTRTAKQANIAQSIVAVTLGMFGGAFFQLNLSGPLGAVLLVNPVTAFTRGLGITAGGGGVADLGVPALVLGLFTAVCLLAAWLVPGRKDLL